jgi:hypothetical protein
LKYFSSTHDPKSRKYVMYYTVALIAVMGTVAFGTFHYIHQPPLLGALTFFEGFFSLFMLSRHEKVGSAFLSHMSKLRQISKLSLF